MLRFALAPVVLAQDLLLGADWGALDGPGRATARVLARRARGAPCCGRGRRFLAAQRPAEAALFLSEAPEPCCGAVRALAWLVLKRPERARESVRELANVLELPGSRELFEMLAGEELQACEVLEGIQLAVERWRSSFTSDCWSRSRKLGTSLAIVEFDDGPAPTDCTLQAVQALDAACGGMDFKPQGYIVRQSRGRQDVGPVQPGVTQVRVVSREDLPDDLEVVVLIMDAQRYALWALKSMSWYLNLGRVYSVQVQLHEAQADDPLAIYEFLVWHGLRLWPAHQVLEDHHFRSVGELQMAVQGRPSSRGLALPLAAHAPFQPPPALRGCGSESNSWAVVGRQVLQRLRGLKRRLGRAVGVTLSANAYGYGDLVMGRLLAPEVRLLAVTSFERALQLEGHVLLLHQPPSELLCRMAQVAISVQSFAWLLGARGHRCKTPLRLHLELDTGIGRAGLRGITAAVHLIAKQWPRIRLRGLHTKLCCSGNAGLTTKAFACLGT